MHQLVAVIRCVTRDCHTNQSEVCIRLTVGYVGISTVLKLSIFLALFSTQIKMGIYEWEYKFDACSFPQDQDLRVIATGVNRPRLRLSRLFSLVTTVCSFNMKLISTRAGLNIKFYQNVDTLSSNSQGWQN